MNQLILICLVITISASLINIIITLAQRYMGEELYFMIGMVVIICIAISVVIFHYIHY